MTMTNENIFEGDVRPISEQEVTEQPQPKLEPQMEQGGDIGNVQSASIEGEPPIQEMEQGGEVYNSSNRLILDWGLVFTFFK